MHARTAVFKNKHGFIPVFKWFPLNAKCFRFGVKPKAFPDRKPEDLVSFWPYFIGILRDK